MYKVLSAKAERSSVSLHFLAGQNAASKVPARSGNVYSGSMMNNVHHIVGGTASGQNN